MESMGVATGCGCKEVYRLPIPTPFLPTRVSFRILGEGGKCRVGAEEGGHASRACVAPRGGLGVLPQKFLKFQMLRDRISCHLN